MSEIVPPRRVSQRVAMQAIKIYQNILSPMMLHQCRFFPSCSSYAEQAISAHGLARGLWKTAKRLLRCHPFCASGCDPI
jgi:putative membrane protein insertion efficiency factor